MTYIDNLLTSIIPPQDFKHREGFSNSKIIDTLTDFDKTQVEEKLIYMLLYDKFDSLIVKTLTYLKSIKSVPIFKTLLKSNIDEVAKILIASCIYNLVNDEQMINIAIDSFNAIDKKNAYYEYSVIEAFYYLATFKVPKINSIILEFKDNPQILISYNAKRALTVDKKY